MSTDTTIVKPTTPLFDEARLAIAGFLARYSGPTRVSYPTDPAPVLRLVRPARPRGLHRATGDTLSYTPAPLDERPNRTKPRIPDR